uniref:Uncharacterized protein n=1 Tax=Acrobeloides nanus TaxID=290746 RepID=A0A914D8B8_9BILA
VYIRSTDVNRTLVSAYSNLAGMYPVGVPGVDYPGDYDKWPSKWTPIPVHTIPEDMDHIGNIFAPCPRADELDEFIRNSSEFKQYDIEYKEFFALISQKTGKRFTFDNIHELHDTQYIESIYNLTQPEWMTPDVVSTIRNLSRASNEFVYGISKPYVPEMIKLRGGSMLKALVDKMNYKIACNQPENDNSHHCKWIQ